MFLVVRAPAPSQQLQRAYSAHDAAAFVVLGLWVSNYAR